MRQLAVNPQYADAHNNLGLALGSLGRKAEAITHFQRALAIRPAYADAQINLSMVESGSESAGRSTENWIASKDLQNPAILPRASKNNLLF